MGRRAISAIPQLEARFQLSQTYRKKVLLYLRDSIPWKRYIQDVLYHEFGNALFSVSEEVLDIHKYDVQQLGINGIISTIPVEERDLTILQISVVPTRRELDDIQEFLHKKRGLLYENDIINVRKLPLSKELFVRIIFLSFQYNEYLYE